MKNQHKHIETFILSQGLNIGENTVREIQEFMKNGGPRSSIDVYGRDVKTGLPRRIEFTWSELKHNLDRDEQG